MMIAIIINQAYNYNYLENIFLIVFKYLYIKTLIFI